MSRSPLQRGPDQQCPFVGLSPLVLTYQTSPLLAPGLTSQISYPRLTLCHHCLQETVSVSEPNGPSGWGHSQPGRQGAAGHQQHRRRHRCEPSSIHHRQWEPSRGLGGCSEGQQSACPHPCDTAVPSLRTTMSSFPSARPWSVPRGCSKAIRTGTDQEARDPDRVPMGSLDLGDSSGRVRVQTMEQGGGERQVLEEAGPASQGGARAGPQPGPDRRVELTVG